MVSTFSVDAQNEVIGGCVKKDGIASGINATKRFPMYSVMKFPQALYVADFLNRNNIELNTEVIVWKDDLMQDTWSPMLKQCLRHSFRTLRRSESCRKIYPQSWIQEYSNPKDREADAHQPCVK